MHNYVKCSFRYYLTSFRLWSLHPSAAGPVAGSGHLPSPGLGAGRQRGAGARPTAGATHRTHGGGRPGWRGRQPCREQCNRWGVQRPGRRGRRGGRGAGASGEAGAHIPPGHGSVCVSAGQPELGSGALPGCLQGSFCRNAGAADIPHQNPGR